MNERFTMLVVEDNDIQRHAVASLAFDVGLDIDIEEASDGREALKKLKTKTFDILFTDIKMPFLDGLQLAEQAKQIDNNIQIIIFSAFDEFQFAQKAIEVGVYQYILKPLVINDFVALMQGVMTQSRIVKAERQRLKDLEKLSLLHRETLRNKALIDIVFGRPLGKEAQELIDEIPVFSSKYSKRLVLANFDNDFVLAHEDMIQDYFGSLGILCITLDTSQFLLFVEDRVDCSIGVEQVSSDFAEQFSAFSEGRMCLAIGLSFDDIKLLPERFTKLEGLADKRFFYVGNTILLESKSHVEQAARQPAGDTSIIELIKVVNGLFLEGKYEIAGQRINAFFANPQLDDHSHYQIQYAGCRLMEHMTQYNNQLAFAGYIDRIHGMASADEINDFLLSNLLIIRDQAYESMNSQLIHQVISLIKEHYQENIGLEWLAEQAGFSAGYLSAYFKLKMGITLSHYLAQHRVNCAVQLLKNTNMKINDIAIKAGYPNYSYFCTLFKKYTGMTPAQCRGGEAGTL
jgi:two-component system response regulator YesN